MPTSQPRTPTPTPHAYPTGLPPAYRHVYDRHYRPTGNAIAIGGVWRPRPLNQQQPSSAQDHRSMTP